MTFTDRITNARRALTEGADPDGPDTWQALLLAHRAAAVAAYATDTAPRWGRYGQAIADAIAHLAPPLADTGMLPAELRPALADVNRLADPVRALVQRLADVFTAGAEGETGTPWRRLIWAQVAHRLDDARRDLP
ncbi:hypothetical protein GCM10009557_15470 [Virgisporangium ochraceum]|uniref:Uncharacterized protein n=1 Tax=Virgisporangium ochraceum TaxID=65505 RepID=A0A8J3ZUZ5_9ACTN|nr:hypothetical protein [Virgisporangium ochraceum]GIJ67941.1 hypothetical protein Voc01_028580 [Virgisporangium ochraceum]